MTLKVTFAVEIFLTPISHETWHEFTSIARAASLGPSAVAVLLIYRESCKYLHAAIAAW